MSRIGLRKRGFRLFFFSSLLLLRRQQLTLSVRPPVLCGDNGAIRGGDEGGGSFSPAGCWSWTGAALAVFATAMLPRLLFHSPRLRRSAEAEPLPLPCEGGSGGQAPSESCGDDDEAISLTLRKKQRKRENEYDNEIEERSERKEKKDVAFPLSHRVDRKRRASPLVLSSSRLLSCPLFTPQRATHNSLLVLSGTQKQEKSENPLSPTSTEKTTAASADVSNLVGPEKFDLDDGNVPGVSSSSGAEREPLELNNLANELLILMLAAVENPRWVREGERERGREGGRARARARERETERIRGKRKISFSYKIAPSRRSSSTSSLLNPPSSIRTSSV